METHLLENGGKVILAQRHCFVVEFLQNSRHLQHLELLDR